MQKCTETVNGYTQAEISDFGPKFLSFENEGDRPITITGEGTWISYTNVVKIVLNQVNAMMFVELC